MRAVMNDLQAIWTEQFAADGLTYEPTQLVLFTGAVDTGCGQATVGGRAVLLPAPIAWPTSTSTSSTSSATGSARRATSPRRT